MNRPAALPADPTARPVFRDGQVLRAADLQNEAGANVAAGHRHQRLAHLPGIVAGLWLTDGEAVSPGMAVDAAGRTILVPRERPVERPDYVPLPAEVWLAYLEVEAPPGRLTDQFEILFYRPGAYDPLRPEDHPQQAVFLGTLRDGQADHAGRVYVGAVGVRVEAASRRARLLLGPEGASDSRLFAVGTWDAKRREYTDHLALESGGAIRLGGPVAVAGYSQPPKGTAAVVVGGREVEFRATDVTDAVGLLRRMDQFPGLGAEVRASATTAEDARLKARSPGAALAALLARLLNRAVGRATTQTVATLADAVRAAGAPLRAETVRLLLNQAAGLPRADEHRLTRLLLEDAFPDHLQRLPGGYDGPRGVAFVGPRPAPATAFPNRVYLATVEEKAGPRRELRVEFAHPGKDNNPERYKVVVGTVQPDPKDPTKTAFAECLTADAAGKVTVVGDLRVYTDASGAKNEGLILEVKGPGQAASQANQLRQAAPWDLAIRRVTPAAPAGARAVTITSGELANTGQAPITAVQLHAVVFAKNDTKFEPAREALLRNLVLEPGSSAPILTPDNKPIEIPLSSDLANARPLTLVLMAVGAGPGNVIASAERRLDIP